MSNPLGLEDHSLVVQVLTGPPVLLPVCILDSALSLVWRYRHSGGEVRLQIRWVAFAAAGVGIAFAVTLVGGLFLTAEQERPLWLALLQDAVLISYAGVPIAIGFAVLKYRLYDIDLLINRTIVYSSLTAMLMALYFAGVATTQAVLQALTGREELPQIAVVASTLVIAALFNPLRHRTQSFIDRRFYRNKYDAAKTLEAFSAKLRDETDLESLNTELRSVVRKTMQPAHVSLWVCPPPHDEVRSEIEGG